MVCRVALLLSVLVAAATILSAIAAPVDRDVQLLPEYEDPGYALAMLSRLLHTNALENLLHPSAPGRKRGLDLGLGRGFSGSQAAKHLMGLSAATFAGGPGRRKREVVVASGHGAESVLTHPRQLFASEDDSNSKLAVNRR